MLPQVQLLGSCYLEARNRSGTVHSIHSIVARAACLFWYSTGQIHGRSFADCHSDDTTRSSMRHETAV